MLRGDSRGVGILAGVRILAAGIPAEGISAAMAVVGTLAVAGTATVGAGIGGDLPPTLSPRNTRGGKDGAPGFG